MRPPRPHGGCSRRVFLASMAACGTVFPAERGQIFPAEWKRYPDPATEFEVLRLTDPASECRMPPPYSRATARRGAFLLFSSDREGSVQIYRLDLKSGAIRQLTDADGGVDPMAFCLLPGDRAFLFVAGRRVFTAGTAGSAPREIAALADDYEKVSGLSVSEDGLHAALVEQLSGSANVRLLDLRRATITTLAEVKGVASDPQPRPSRASVLYTRNGAELWLVHYDGKQNRRIPSLGARVGTPAWSHDGRTIVYLSFPDDPKVLNTLREVNPDTGADQAVGRTSQFIAMGRNGDSSVFVGASSSKASPYVLLLLRVTQREFTLCEHKASQPSLVLPAFAPNSQRIFFQSDRHGKMAIYSMNIEKLVENTESEEEEIRPEPPKRPAPKK